jgi:hypothetical protein
MMHQRWAYQAGKLRLKIFNATDVPLKLMQLQLFSLKTFFLAKEN